jgi:hypothetical protein
VSLTVLGLAALGAAASRGHDTYVLGCDVLGAELPAAPSTPITEYIQPTQYRTQVAAGLTVVAAWALISHLKMRK